MPFQLICIPVDLFHGSNIGRIAWKTKERPLHCLGRSTTSISQLRKCDRTNTKSRQVSRAFGSLHDSNFPASCMRSKQNLIPDWKKTGHHQTVFKQGRHILEGKCRELHHPAATLQECWIRERFRGKDFSPR